MKKIECPKCKKKVNCKVIKTWKKSVRYEDPNDGQSVGVRWFVGTTVKFYERVIILHHTKGFFTSKRCEGSGRKRVILVRELI